MFMACVLSVKIKKAKQLIEERKVFSLVINIKIIKLIMLTMIKAKTE